MSRDFRKLAHSFGSRFQSQIITRHDHQVHTSLTASTKLKSHEQYYLTIHSLFSIAILYFPVAPKPTSRASFHIFFNILDRSRLKKTPTHVTSNSNSPRLKKKGEKRSEVKKELSGAWLNAEVAAASEEGEKVMSHLYTTIASRKIQCL